MAGRDTGLRKLRDFVQLSLLKFLGPTEPDWLASLIMARADAAERSLCRSGREYIEPKSKVLLAILASCCRRIRRSWKLFLTAFSIVGQCHFYCSHKPIIRLLIGEDEYRAAEPNRVDGTYDAVHPAGVKIRLMATENTENTEKIKDENTNWPS